ncbi:MAG: hypothetical protein QME77_01975 [bacterium]|nr:hypothetical protein [bacterium]
MPRSAHFRARALGLALIGALALSAPLGAAWSPLPPGGIATLSFIGEDAVDLVYQSRDIPLNAASFAQTLAAVSIVASTPPSPINPVLVQLGLGAAGIPYLPARSCWPGDGALAIVPTAPAGAVDLALSAAGKYFDPNTQAHEFATAYWQRLFTTTPRSEPAPPGWPGQPALEALKESIVGGLPFPSNLGPMTTYQARGIVPFLMVRGDYVPVCFFFICFWFPKCQVVFAPSSEGYGLREVR